MAETKLQRRPETEREREIAPGTRRGTSSALASMQAVAKMLAS